jgi:hypothetical protein
VHRGDAGGDRVDGGEADGAIIVFGLHQRTEAGRYREVAERRNVRTDERSERGGPHVEMRIDEAGHADHAGAIDDLSRWRFDLLGDRDNGAVADVHVAHSEVGHGRIHGEHGATADDELAARGQGYAGCAGIAHGPLREEPARCERR